MLRAILAVLVFMFTAPSFAVDYEKYKGRNDDTRKALIFLDECRTHAKAFSNKIHGIAKDDVMAKLTESAILDTCSSELLRRNKWIRELTANSIPVPKK